MMKTITLAVTAMLSLAVLTMTAMSQSQTSDTAYEKKSYNYAEWAKGRFSEVVTVRNAGWAASERKMKTAPRAESYGISATSARSAATLGTRLSGFWKSTTRRLRISTRSSPI